MDNNNHSAFLALLAGLVILAAGFSGCTPGATAESHSPSTDSQTSGPLVPSPAPSSTPTHVALPAFALQPGDFYFSLDGQPAFLFSRNIAGYQRAHYQTFLDWSASGGSRFVRIQLDSLGMGYTSSGAVDESWATQWEWVFDQARQGGLYILPVFSGWFDWNSGPGYSTWNSNPMNSANGGPVKTPAELFQKDSKAQNLWLHWLQSLVQRWQGRENILGWEIFSEVNLASGEGEQAGIDFVNRAASVIRAADPARRPITASIADTGTWPDFYRQTSIDFINIHPYPASGQLDRVIVSETRRALVTYHRPVLLGESGLSATSPDSREGNISMADNATAGVEHAIWAAVVSGSMNGRALYWEDSFAVYFQGLGMSFIGKYADAELPAAQFVQGVDFSGFMPLNSTSTRAIWGAVIGNANTALGWFRDANCEPPDWNLQPVISHQTVTISLPGKADRWRVDFYDTRTGTDLLGSIDIARTGDTVTIPLPDFKNDIAFKMRAQK